ncbi:hypothetical protein ASG11_05765 [Sphingomonas sp. Leaf357]|uniref:hypothetical protein n=1 Tax=Sphingomonas sp. Leaf357 TaxID=1736350 RepID=UPI0006F62389|nr:hypothetical protein [Sphingomonas sp. Leaf357]KQS03810.1 hypothetical protein ASG11_05765 [Sphingomonas sp. Leaf357]
MTLYPIGLHAMRTPALHEQAAALDQFAASFALNDQVESELLITAFCTEAIRQWRLNDATFWQRVKFRARLLRAITPDSGSEDFDDRRTYRSSERSV